MADLIGRYEVVREVGRGGMAVVYLARDPHVNRQVAVKVLPRQFTYDPQFRARFQREAEAVAALEHPAIVPVYDYGEHNEQPYLVMRYMAGGSLSARMERGPLSLTDISNVFARLAAALDAAHQHGMIHRDLKPGNIMFDQWGEAYLSDFGIVKMSEGASTFTTTGGIMGTPAYMSPEQARGISHIDGRSDVYALGVVLFELLTGQLPYKADTPMGLALAHVTEPVPHVLNIKSNLPPASETIITRALAKSPDERYPTAGHLASDIQALATGAPLSELPSPWALTKPRTPTPTPPRPPTPAEPLPPVQRPTPTPPPPPGGTPPTPAPKASVALPPSVQRAMSSSMEDLRESALRKLEDLLNDPSPEMAAAALAALQQMSADPNKRIAQAAAKAVSHYQSRRGKKK